MTKWLWPYASFTNDMKLNDNWIGTFCCYFEPKLVRFILHGSVHWTMKRTDHSSQLNISNKYKYIVKWRYAWIYSKCILSWYFACACACVYMWTLSTWILFNCWLVTKGKPSNKKKPDQTLGFAFMKWICWNLIEFPFN